MFFLSLLCPSHPHPYSIHTDCLAKISRAGPPHSNTNPTMGRKLSAKGRAAANIDDDSHEPCIRTPASDRESKEQTAHSAPVQLRTARTSRPVAFWEFASSLLVRSRESLIPSLRFNSFVPGTNHARITIHSPKPRMPSGRVAHRSKLSARVWLRPSVPAHSHSATPLRIGTRCVEANTAQV